MTALTAQPEWQGWLALAVMTAAIIPAGVVADRLRDRRTR